MARLLAVLFATAAWGVDNTVSRALADRDPAQFVMFQGALGAAATALLALAFDEPLPGTGPALAFLAVGATGYGLNLRFYLLAQRAFGAARTGSVFAVRSVRRHRVGVHVRRTRRQCLDACGGGADGLRHRAASGGEPQPRPRP